MSVHAWDFAICQWAFKACASRSGLRGRPTAAQDGRLPGMRVISVAAQAAYREGGALMQEACRRVWAAYLARSGAACMHACMQRETNCRVRCAVHYVPLYYCISMRAREKTAKHHQLVRGRSETEGGEREWPVSAGHTEYRTHHACAPGRHYQSSCHSSCLTEGRALSRSGCRSFSASGYLEAKT